MTSSSGPRENTAEERSPLMRSSRTKAENDGDGNDSIQTPLAPHDKKLFKGFAASLGLHLAGLILVFVCSWMGAYGRDKYRFWDTFELMTTQRMIIQASLWTVPYNIANLVVLKRWAKPIPAFFNILYFAVTAIVCAVSVIFHVGSRFLEPPKHCDEAKHLGGETYDDCLGWAPKYEGVVWMLFVDLAAFAVTQVYLLVLSITDLTRRRPSSSGRSLGPDNKWVLPLGQLSVELSIRWGHPQAQQPIKTQAPEGS